MTQFVSQDSFSHLAFWGAMRSSAGFPFEHPLELLKSKCQCEPEFSTVRVSRKLFQQEGILGFRQTAILNLPRRLLREVVRWPVIESVHRRLTCYFPESFSKGSFKSQVTTGALVGIFESIVILPLEQLMVYRVKESARYRDFFFNRFVVQGLPSLYRGIGINFVYRTSVWINLMACNSEVKKQFDKIDREGKHPYLRQMATSVTVASSTILWGLPIDFVKTQIQIHPDFHNKRYLDVVPKIWNRYRIPHFYAGAIPVFIHTVFHVTLGGYILDQIFSKRNLS